MGGTFKEDLAQYDGTEWVDGSVRGVGKDEVLIESMIPVSVLRCVCILALQECLLAGGWLTWNVWSRKKPFVAVL